MPRSGVELGTACPARPAAGWVPGLDPNIVLRMNLSTVEARGVLPALGPIFRQGTLFSDDPVGVRADLKAPILPLGSL